MQYFLRLGVLGECPIITIDSERFLLLKSSRRILPEALAVEEEYEMVISNYIDLEKESLNMAIFYMTRNYQGYPDSFSFRLTLNRLFMNLLTSVRLYRDRLSSHCVNCLPKETEVKERIEQLFSTEYDTNFNYRFMEAFRNYIQHYGSAIHSISFGGRRTSTDDKGLFEYYSSLSADKKFLKSDRHFKRSILKEIPEKVDLILASRDYIESFSNIHINARKIISNSIENARKITQTAIDDYKLVYKKDFVGLTAYMVDDNTKKEEIPVLLNWDDIRQELEKRNTQLVNLKKRYPTGQIISK